MESFFGFLSAHERTLGWIAFVSLIAFIVTLITIPLLIINIPHNYFSTRRPSALPWRFQSPWLNILAKVLKNLLGFVFLVAGVAMLVLPGQGIISILAGMILLDFPGKRAMELLLVARPRVLGALNWIRTKANRRPLIVPPGKNTEKP